MRPRGRRTGERRAAGLAAAAVAMSFLAAGDAARGGGLLRDELVGIRPPLLLAAAPEEPAGYRMSDYRAPTPAGLDGGTVVSTAEARRLWEDRAAVFIDVLPRPPKPDNLPEDIIWRPPSHPNIPGSVWLPNVGFGQLPPELEDYFRNNLDRLSDGDPVAGLLFYCQKDCWMSWNAAKRALEFGYRNVYWYPDGTDGWSAQGHALENGEPVAMMP